MAPGLCGSPPRNPIGGMAWTAAAQIIDMAASLCQIEIPDIDMPSAPARAVIRARRLAEKTTELATAHQERMAALESRITDLQNRKVAIRRARLAGDVDDERQGPELALIDADLAGLVDLHARTTKDAPDQMGADADLRLAGSNWAAAVEAERERVALAVIADLQSRLALAIERTRGVPFAHRIDVDRRIQIAVAQGGGHW